MKNASKKDRRAMRALTGSTLCLLLAAAVHAASVEMSAPSMAAGITAHIASVPQTGAAPDTGALLSSIQARITSSDATPADVAAGMAMIGAATDADKSSSLEIYLSGQAGAIKSMDALYNAVQSDPAALKEWKTAGKKLQVELAKLGKLDAAQMAALWDGSLPQTGEASFAAAPVVAPAAGMKDAVASPAIALAPAPALQTQAQTRVAPPSPTAATGLAAIMAGAPAQAPGTTAEPEVKPTVELSAQEKALASEYVSSLVSVKPDDFTKQGEMRKSAASIGFDIQMDAVTKSQLLKRPLAALSGTPVAENVANEMVKLQEEVRGLDPKIANKKALVDMLAAIMPGPISRQIEKRVGTPIKRYRQNHQTASAAIDSIIGSLEKGRGTLATDNTSLREAKVDLQKASLQLRAMEAMTDAVYKGVEAEVKSGKLDAAQVKFLTEEIMVDLSRRQTALHEVLGATEDGIVGSQMLIENNDILIDQVDTAISVVKVALPISAMVANGLNNQKAVLAGKRAAKETVATLRKNTSEALLNQATQIHKDAAGPSEKEFKDYEAASNNLAKAITQIQDYKREILPKQRANIKRLQALAAKNAETIKRMDAAELHRADVQALFDEKGIKLGNK